MEHVYRFILCLLSLQLWLGLASASASSRTVLCHNPADHPVTIGVEESALQAHIQHGDLFGECDVPASERCDDGNPCTVDAFVPGTKLCDPNPQVRSCNDGILCTSDTCDPDRGCVSTVTCGPEAPVCDPAATDPSAACTGAPEDCPLDLIAEVNGWNLREVASTQCIEIRGFGTFELRAKEARDEAAGLCGEGDQNISCCAEACDCTCEDGPGWVEKFLADPPVSRTAISVRPDAASSHVFQVDNDIDNRCLNLFTSPSAALSCLEGICTAPLDTVRTD
jgi:hypothetical protein